MGKAFPLRNHHTVFILGAGFSRLRGLPLINDFALRMRDAAIWCEKSGRSDETESIYEVLQFRLDAASAAYRISIDLENIEELFSLASAASPEIANHVRVAIAATINYCATTRPHPQVLFNPNFKGHVDLKSFGSIHDSGNSRADIYTVLMHRLLKETSPQEFSFITFNYDLVLEEALKNLGRKWDYCLHGEPSLDALPLLKLHGSMNWAERTTGKTEAIDSYEVLRDEKAQLGIVPPTWNKILTPSLQNVWKVANKQLTDATNIVVVGFSMPPTDLHFKYLLASGMKGNVSLRKIVFLDPNDKVPERASRIFNPREIESKRVEFHAIKLEDYLFTGPRESGWYGIKDKVGPLY